MFEYSPAWPHGTFQIAFPDIFFVIGTNKTQHAGVDIQTLTARLNFKFGPRAGGVAYK